MSNHPTGRAINVRLSCEHPVQTGRTVDTCDKPAAWSTDDLQSVHYLCEEHCKEALIWNDFDADPVST